MITAYLSGGAGNASPALSLGGTKSSVAVPEKLFGPIRTDEWAGTTSYRCIYVSTDEALNNVTAWVEEETPSTSTTVAIGWGAAGIGATETAVASQTTAPAGVTFSTASEAASGPSGGDFEAGQFRALWIRYTITATTPIVRESFTISVDGDPVTYTANSNHFGLVKGWANTNGHLSGPGGTYTVIQVTNRNASGAGSLKAAIETAGARLIVFTVSGNIDMAGADLSVTNPYMTIAGQTAPYPGITIIKGQILTSTHNLIFQHLKIRPGSSAGTDKDGVETRPGSYDVIFSHCSLSWGTDGSIDIAGFNLSGSDPAVWRSNTSHRITLDRCLIGETLVGGGDSASGATLFEDNASYIMAYGCAWINNHTRCPLLKGGTWAAVINSLIYNSQDKFIDQTLQASAWSGKTYQAAKLDAIGVYAKAGPETSSAVALFEVVSNGPAIFYGNDNICLYEDGVTQYPETHITANTASYNTGGTLTIATSAQLTGHGITPIPKLSVPAMIQASVGAFPWDRDAIDTRLLLDFTNGTGAYKAVQAETGGSGGYPPSVNNSRAFNAAHWNLASAGVEPIHEDALQLGTGPTAVPVNTVLPGVTGTTTVDSTLTTSNGTWTNTPTSYNRQWQVSDNGTTGWTNISGATSSTLLLEAGHETKYIRSGVAGVNGIGAGTMAYSAATAQISAAESNLLTMNESTFAATGRWEFFGGPPSWSISSGAARITATAAGNRWIYIPGILTDGATYRVALDLTVTAGAITLDMGGAAVDYTTSGAKEWIIANSGAGDLSIMARETFIGSIDNVHVSLV